MHCNIPVHSAGRTYSMVMKPMVAQQIGEIVVLFMIEPWNLVTVGLSRLCEHNFKHNRGWKA